MEEVDPGQSMHLGLDAWKGLHKSQGRYAPRRLGKHRADFISNRHRPSEVLVRPAGKLQSLGIHWFLILVSKP